ncbi:hypothetical protein CLAIMM_05920 [Cladophialophora immunda]|nr:hypothetical protein CLAIMM_05920 [Cladophialophora immunda]
MLEVAAEIDVVPPEGLLSIVVTAVIVLEAETEETMVVGAATEGVATEPAKPDEVVPDIVGLDNAADKDPIDPSEPEERAILLDVEAAAIESAIVPPGAPRRVPRIEDGPKENTKRLGEL